MPEWLIGTVSKTVYAERHTRVRIPPSPLEKSLKISYPRTVPQGGSQERDMHEGQQYVRLLDLELEAVGYASGARKGCQEPGVMP